MKACSVRDPTLGQRGLCSEQAEQSRVNSCPLEQYQHADCKPGAGQNKAGCTPGIRNKVKVLTVCKAQKQEFWRT
jgi:hypothetical protein